MTIAFCSLSFPFCEKKRAKACWWEQIVLHARQRHLPLDDPQTASTTIGNRHFLFLPPEFRCRCDTLPHQHCICWTLALCCCCYLKACSCSLWISAVQTIYIFVNIVEAKQQEADNCGPDFFFPFVAATWRSYILCTFSRRRWQNPHQKRLTGCCHGCRCGQNSRSYSCTSAHSKPRKLRL